MVLKPHHVSFLISIVILRLHKSRADAIEYFRNNNVRYKSKKISIVCFQVQKLTWLYYTHPRKMDAA